MIFVFVFVSISILSGQVRFMIYMDFGPENCEIRIFARIVIQRDLRGCPYNLHMKSAQKIQVEVNHQTIHILTFVELVYLTCYFRKINLSLGYRLVTLTCRMALNHPDISKNSVSSPRAFHEDDAFIKDTLAFPHM